MPKNTKLPGAHEMIDKGYIYDRTETFGETYKRLSALRLWKAYRLDQQQLMDSGVSEKVIEDTLWGRYSPNALIERALVAKEIKDNGVGSEPPTQADLAWVYQNLDQKVGTYFTDAPSAGASSLLEKARDDVRTYQWVLEHLSPKTFADSGGTSWESDQARSLTGIARQLRESFNERRTKLLHAKGAGSEDKSREPVAS